MDEFDDGSDEYWGTLEEQRLQSKIISVSLYKKHPILDQLEQNISSYVMLMIIYSELCGGKNANILKVMVAIEKLPTQLVEDFVLLKLL